MFILFCIFVWQIRDSFRCKVICCFWCVAIKIILNNYIKRYSIKSVLLQNVQVLVCGRRLKRKIKVSFHRDFSGMDAFICVSGIALLVHDLNWKCFHTINVCNNILMDIVLWSQGKRT